MLGHGGSVRTTCRFVFSLLLLLSPVVARRSWDCMTPSLSRLRDCRYFDDVRVPASNLIGEEGKGFKGIMYNFNQEVRATAPTLGLWGWGRD